jgi:hypothetical protein
MPDSNTTPPPPAPDAAPIAAWLDDPADRDSAKGGQLIAQPIPSTEKGPLPTRIAGDAPNPDRYPVGSAGFRYWNAAVALHRASDFWGSILGAAQRWNPAVGSTLQVVLDDDEEDLNAYYDRRALRFFHATIGDTVVYSGESPDVVCHELGHAVLDAVRPQLWDAAAIEVGAFHESFGDMSTLLTALQLGETRRLVLQETRGHLYRTSRLSRLAEQLGWGIRQAQPRDVEPDCLRNAVNGFFYQSPDALPTTGSAAELSSEPHSFSRVFTAAFFDALARMFASRGAVDEAVLQEVSVDLANMLITAVRRAPVVPDYFSQVGAALVNAAIARSQAYGDAVRTALTRHGILSVAGAVGIARAPQPPAFAAAAAAAPPNLPLHELDVSSYGFTVPAIKLQVAGQPKHLSFTGAALDVGDVHATSSDHAARAFFEDLLRRGRLDPNGFADPGVTLTDSETVKTHQLTQEGSDVVLRRDRIDCIPRRFSR